MAQSRSIEMPPGSSLVFEVEVDEFGNLTYIGDPWIIGGVIIPPTVNTPPVPRTTVPPDPTPPGGRNLFNTLKEGFRVREAGVESAEIIPSSINGWVNGEAVRVRDGINATIQAPDAVYCDALELKTFDVSRIPPDAQITGIKVTVTRSKI